MSNLDIEKQDADEIVPDEMAEKIDEDKEWIKQLMLEYNRLLKRFNQKIKENNGMTLLQQKILASKLVEPSLGEKEMYSIDHFFNRLDESIEKRSFREREDEIEEMDMMMLNIKDNMREELNRYYESKLPEGHLDSLEDKLFRHIDEKIFELDQSEYEDCLVKGEVPQKLEDAFEENGYPIDDEFNINKRKGEWYIRSDKDEPVIYTIRVEDDMIKIHEPRNLGSTNAKLFVARTVADNMDKRKFWLLSMLFGHIEQEFVVNKVTTEMENCCEEMGGNTVERREEKRSLGMMFR